MKDSCSREKWSSVHCSVIMVIVPSQQESGEILKQILLEMLTNCTEHFDLSSSLTASCVTRFMIC